MTAISGKRRASLRWKASTPSNDARIVEFYQLARGDEQFVAHIWRYEEQTWYHWAVPQVHIFRTGKSVASLAAAKEAAMEAVRKWKL